MNSLFVILQPIFITIALFASLSSQALLLEGLNDVTYSRGKTSFLAPKPRYVATCDKYPRVCAAKGSRGPDCCKKQCVNVSKIDQIVENVVTSASTRRYAAKGCVWTYMLTRSIVASVIMNAKKEVHALMECATMLKLGHYTFIEVIIFGNVRCTFIPK